MAAFKHLKIEKAHGTFEVCTEIIQACGDVEISAYGTLAENTQWNEMPADWANSVAIPIFKGKGDIMNCGMYRGVNLIEHVIKKFA